MLGRTATSSIAHDFENNDFGVGRNVNFFTEANFILMNTKLTNLNQKNYLLNICIQIKWAYETLFET